MAFVGTLDHFGIAEILQLIGQQTKNGQLRLRSQGVEVRIWFDGGDIVAAEQTGGHGDHRLGQLLVRAGLIKEQDLEDALDEQRRTLRRLGDILVSRGALQPGELEEMARLQTTEILYGLFTWKSGSYEFVVGEVRERGFFAPIRAEAVLMEGFRMLDEWPLLEQRLPSRKVAFERLAPLPDGNDAPAEIGPAERRVYDLVKSGRSVARLIELSRLGEFETCKALCTLLDHGLLATTELEADVGRRRSRSRWQGRAAAAGTWMLLVVFAGLVLVFAWKNVTDDWRAVPTLQTMVERRDEALLLRRLEIFRLETGSLPDTLEELGGEGPIPPGWRYEKVEPQGAFVLGAPTSQR